jgi:pyruvate dehydrogenase E2 component (dihydrolipoamide acetyltransferase)
MLTKITMPSGGTNTDQLRVVSWKKQEGDAVKRGDILLEVETDKAMLEVESFAKGTLLKRLVEEGSFGTVGEVIAYIGEPGDLKDLEAEPAASQPAAGDQDDAASSQPTAGDQADSAPPEPAPAPLASETTQAPQVDGSSRGLKATPAAKKEVRDRGLDLAEVHRSVGKEILRRSDVTRFAGVSAGAFEATPTTPPTGDMTGFTLVPLTSMRRIIAERMGAGSSVPTFVAEIEVDMTGCIQLRSDLNQHFKGRRFAYHDIIAKCAAIAAGDFPFVNASFTAQGIRVFQSVNVGIAVSLEEGLVVPVVCDVRGMDIGSLAEANAANIAQVRTGKFDRKLLENGTLTISNLGMYPITRFTAILNPPQSCILAVSSTQSRGVWADGQLREQPTAAITGTFDHRIVDGKYGAEFLTRLKELLERPQLLLAY